MFKSSIKIFIVSKTISFRKRNKKTQRDIAEILNTSAGYIGQIESKNSPSMYSYEQLNKLAKYFECSPKDFLPEEPIEE